MMMLAGACLLAFLMQGCTQKSAYIEPKAFGSPEDAVTAMAAAFRTNDPKQLSAIFGSDGDELVFSGDEGADAQVRQKFVKLYDEKHSIVKEKSDKATLLLGKNDWPFPIPVIKDGDQWVFDAESGAEEILNRRIGANELSAIQVCKAIGDAQQEYALRDPDGDGVNDYAQQFPSDPGKRNGLYWPPVANEPPSPLGDFVAQATAEGYVRRQEGPTPYHGYYYRILKGQGPHAPGGAADYVVKGKMTLGYAVLAYPATYDNSGIMSFIMGSDGVVYQSDLGENTAKVAGEIKVFDPDPKKWKKVD